MPLYSQVWNIPPWVGMGIDGAMTLALCKVVHNLMVQISSSISTNDI